MADPELPTGGSTILAARKDDPTRRAWQSGTGRSEREFPVFCRARVDTSGRPIAACGPMALDSTLETTYRALSRPAVWPDRELLEHAEREADPEPDKGQ